MEENLKNLIIESDNLIAMEELLPVYEGKVDVMPIDPPYNTDISHIGYKDSGYADGWVAFMRPRLELAYRLLSPTGVMFIHIDESEFANLWTLCSEIFGGHNLISMIWKKTNPMFDANRKEKPLESGLRRTHEFIVVCFKDRANTTLAPVMQPYLNGSVLEERLQPLETVVDFMGTTASAKDELAELLGEYGLFATPKPVKMIREFIRSVGNPHALVMDFFAGSGTTGHATLALNSEDGGQRRFILITNNESDICKRVTVPRVRAAMERYGRKDSESSQAERDDDVRILFNTVN
jgi:adenine specific DNA methylase Mod